MLESLLIPMVGHLVDKELVRVCPVIVSVSREVFALWGQIDCKLNAGDSVPSIDGVATGTIGALAASYCKESWPCPFTFSSLVEGRARALVFSPELGVTLTGKGECL